MFRVLVLVAQVPIPSFSLPNTPTLKSQLPLILCKLGLQIENTPNENMSVS